jgi:hypothetical protein
MTYKDLDHQAELITKHLAMAKQCYEYEKLEDGNVHLMIAEILMDGFKKAKPTYEEESLNNLAQSLTN